MSAFGRIDNIYDCMAKPGGSHQGKPTHTIISNSSSRAEQCAPLSCARAAQHGIRGIRRSISSDGIYCTSPQCQPPPSAVPRRQHCNFGRSHIQSYPGLRSLHGHTKAVSTICCANCEATHLPQRRYCGKECDVSAGLLTQRMKASLTQSTCIGSGRRYYRTKS